MGGTPDAFQFWVGRYRAQDLRTPNGCVKWLVKLSSCPRIVCDLSEVGSGCFASFVPATAPPWRQTHMGAHAHMQCVPEPDQSSGK